MVVGGLRLRLEPTQFEAAPQRGFPAWHSMRITLLRRGMDDRAWERTRELFEVSRLTVRGASGRRSYQESPGRETAADSVSVVVRSPAGDPDSWLGPAPRKLIIEVPTRVVEVDVPFLFEDVALPGPNQAAAK